MVQRIDQFEVFLKMAEAMEIGRYSQLKKADKLVRKALLNNRERQIKQSVFDFKQEEMALINSLSQALK